MSNVGLEQDCRPRVVFLLVCSGGNTNILINKPFSKHITYFIFVGDTNFRLRPHAQRATVCPVEYEKISTNLSFQSASCKTFWTLGEHNQMLTGCKILLKRETHGQPPPGPLQTFKSVCFQSHHTLSGGDKCTFLTPPNHPV